MLNMVQANLKHYLERNVWVDTSEIETVEELLCNFSRCYWDRMEDAKSLFEPENNFQP